MAYCLLDCLLDCLLPIGPCKAKAAAKEKYEDAKAAADKLVTAAKEKAEEHLPHLQKKLDEANRSQWEPIRAMVHIQ